MARTLVHEMPGVLAVLAAGEASEWRATIIARETAHLSVEHRAQIDAAIAGELAGWGDARTEREARGWAQRLDPHGAAERAAKAAVDRRVSIRGAGLQDVRDRVAAGQGRVRGLRGTAPHRDERCG